MLEHYIYFWQRRFINIDIDCWNVIDIGPIIWKQ